MSSCWRPDSRLANARFAARLPAFMQSIDEVSSAVKLALHWQMVFYLSAAFMTLVVVSLFTRRVPREKLDRLYACLRTPVEPNEPETTPFTLPAGVEPAPRRVLIDLPDLEIPLPKPVTIIGFVAGWVGVGLLIASVYWLFSLGRT